LIYFLFFLVSPDNRQLYRDELIASYHEHFVEFLKAFGYLKTPPSLLDLRIEMLRNGHLEVLIGVCMSIMFLINFADLDPSVFISASPEQMAEGKKQIFQAPGYKEQLLNELPRWAYNGFI